VTRTRLGRLATVLTASAMALLLVGVGTTIAATPGWTGSNAVAVLGNVGPGKNAAFTITLKNDGPGNISTLYLKADSAASYADNPACSLSPVLYCALGAQNVGQDITITAAFTVPSSTGTFTVTFSESANGFTNSDKNNKSRGDIYSFSASTNVTTGGGDFDGGYNVGNDTFSTNQSVGRHNPQATKLESAPDLLPVTIQDGVTSYPCDTSLPQCSRLIGEWSVLHVGDGSQGPMKVTILIYGNAVQGNPDPSTLYLVHTDLNGTHVIDQQCTYTGGVVDNADCLAGLPTKVGRNYEIVAWLLMNGGIRGGY
jgi:hypothetical protein